MKIKLLFLVGIGFVPLALSGQTAFLYNKGVMSVKASSPTTTTLYIGGDFIAGAGHTTTTTLTRCEIFLSNSRTVLTGNFIHDLNDAPNFASNSHVFYGLGGAYLDPKYDDVGFRNSEFVFRSAAKQTIGLRPAGGAYGPRLNYGANYEPRLKGENYIGFPTLVVENKQHVTLVPELAAQASNLRLNMGRLILDSRRAEPTDFIDITKPTPYPRIPTFQDETTSSMLAHFTVSPAGTIKADNNVTYASTTAIDPLYSNNFGAVQVNLELDDPAQATAAETSGRSLVGMGVPYKSMLSDYFFWNFLMIPKNNSIIGGETTTGDYPVNGNTMTDPQRTLKAGEGFVIGVDLRGENASNYEYDLHPIYQKVTSFKPKFADRIGSNSNTGAMANNIVEKNITGLNTTPFVQNQKYYFSRFGPFFNSSNNVRQANGWGGHAILGTGYDAETMSARANNIVGVANGSDVLASGTGEPGFINEILNYADITGLKIAPGYNYYANPYTVPLDLSSFISGGTGWNVTVGTNAASNDFISKVWILDPTSKGSATYNVTGWSGIEPGNKWVTVKAAYRVINRSGSTAPVYDPGTNGNAQVIGPLQMFVVYSKNGSTTKTLTIPASAKSMGGNAMFLRATSANVLTDDFLFEVKDAKTKSSDKTAIVIRTPQEVMTDVQYSGTKKLVTLISSDQATTTSKQAEGDAATIQNNTSTLYTKSTEGVALESNTLGVPQTAQTQNVTLFVTPSLITQNISITAGRLATANRVKGIKLIDKLKSNSEFDLFTGKAYTVESKPTDPVDRFTLRFVFDTSGFEDDDTNTESKSITSYYANGTLTVTGFDDADFGSTISVYDIQGRTTAQAKVNDTTVEITRAFTPGVYIVKVVGNKSYAAKFLVK